MRLLLDIRTTTGPSGYAVVSGTSFACPHAAGAAGLVWSAFPTLTYLEVKRSLMEGCKPNPKLMGLSACGGTLDLYRALAVAGKEAKRNVRCRHRVGSLEEFGFVF